MELTVEQALQQAIEAHKAGKLQDAEAFYRAILQAQPNHPDANHNLGVLAVSLNKTEAALPLFKIALEANPNQGQFWLSYVDALIKEKQFNNARSVLEQGKKRGLTGEKVDLLEAQLVQRDINLKSQKTEPNKLSKALELREMGRYKEAQDWLTKFLEVEPTDAEGWSLLSQIYMLDKKDAEAERALSKAISINAELPSVHRNQARLLLKRSKPTEALERAKSGYDRSLEDPESWLVLAACLGANQKDHEALKLVERALQAKPNNAEALTNRALIRLRAKDIIGAINDAQMAVSLKPHLSQIWGLLGSLHHQSKNLPDAIEAIKKAHELDPLNVNYMIDLGEFLRQDEKVSEAIDLLEGAIKLAPQNASAWTNLGAAYQQATRIDPAKEAYAKALVINTKSVETLSKLGALQANNGQWEIAKQYFEQALYISPDSVEILCNMGNILQELGRLESAEASYKKAIALKPDFAETHSNLGTLLQKLGRLEEAETSYRKAIELKPAIGEAHSNLGNTLQELGRIGDAEASYRKAIELKPDSSKAHSNLGNLLQGLGRFEEAEASCRKAIALKPDFPEAHSNLGHILQACGRFGNAETSYRKAIELNPDFAEAHNNLGNLLQELGRLEYAEASYRKAIELKPDFAIAHSNLGNTLQELGRFEEAETSFRRGIEQKTDFTEAHYNLGEFLYRRNKYDKAAEQFRLTNYGKSQSYLLMCLYSQDEESLFYEHLDYLISQGLKNALIGALGCRAAIRYGVVKPNLFCNDPLNYVLKADLSKHYDFTNTFVKPSMAILSENSGSDKLQTLIINGRQTRGNLFGLDGDAIDEIKRIINLEVEKYRACFKDSEEGLIRNWPTSYSLYGWLIQMKSGGKLRPHIHENGWISGSIYINVPPKSKTDSGNLVVCIDDEEDPMGCKQNPKKIIDVVTGSLCLFPASLAHYTIPFESEEERVVLAFDVVPT